MLSNPAYPGRRTTVRDAIRRLGDFRQSGDHTFWPDSASLCDEILIRPAHLLGHRQLTDAYLLALAVTNGGRVATFDRSLPLAAVDGANAEHIADLARPRSDDKPGRKRSNE